MSRFFTAILLSVLISSCANSQNREPQLMGAPCEGCEAVLEYDDRNLTNTDTLPDFNKNGIRIKIE